MYSPRLSRKCNGNIKTSQTKKQKKLGQRSSSSTSTKYVQLNKYNRQKVKAIQKCLLNVKYQSLQTFLNRLQHTTKIKNLRSKLEIKTQPVAYHFQETLQILNSKRLKNKVALRRDITLHKIQ